MRHMLTPEDLIAACAADEYEWEVYETCSSVECFSEVLHLEADATPALLLHTVR